MRQEVARELHDDIGQTITAIRTQAGIVQRLAADNAGVKQGGAHIEQRSSSWRGRSLPSRRRTESYTPRESCSICAPPCFTPALSAARR